MKSSKRIFLSSLLISVVVQGCSAKKDPVSKAKFHQSDAAARSTVPNVPSSRVLSVLPNRLLDKRSGKVSIKVENFTPGSHLKVEIGTTPCINVTSSPSLDRKSTITCDTTLSSDIGLQDVKVTDPKTNQSATLEKSFEFQLSEFRKGNRLIPAAIQCVPVAPPAAINSRAGVHLEDVAELRRLAQLDLDAALVTNGGDRQLLLFPRSLRADYTTARNEALALALPTIAFEGQNYTVNIDQISIGDPYRFLHSDNFDYLLEVNDPEWSAIVDDLIKIYDKPVRGLSTLRGILAHLSPAAPAVDDDRKKSMRKRVKALYCKAHENTKAAASAYSDHILPVTSYPQILELPIILEGDNTTTHCIDGLDAQIAIAETSILRQDFAAKPQNLGMAISQILTDYKEIFIRSYPVLRFYQIIGVYNMTFGLLGITLKNDYPVMTIEGLLRTMYVSFGLRGTLNNLLFPRYAQLDNPNFACNIVMNKFLLGDPTNGINLFSPQKMVELVRMAHRRTYLAASPLAIVRGSADFAGVKLGFQFFYDELKKHRSTADRALDGETQAQIAATPSHPDQWRSVDLERLYAQGLKDIVDNGQPNRWVDYSGIDYLWTDDFILQLLISYGYLKRV